MSPHRGPKISLSSSGYHRFSVDTPIKVLPSSLLNKASLPIFSLSIYLYESRDYNHSLAIKFWSSTFPLPGTQQRLAVDVWLSMLLYRHTSPGLAVKVLSSRRCYQGVSIKVSKLSPSWLCPQVLAVPPMSPGQRHSLKVLLLRSVYCGFSSMSLAHVTFLRSCSQAFASQVSLSNIPPPRPHIQRPCRGLAIQRPLPSSHQASAVHNSLIRPPLAVPKVLLSSFDFPGLVVDV